MRFAAPLSILIFAASYIMMLKGIDPTFTALAAIYTSTTLAWQRNNGE